MGESIRRLKAKSPTCSPVPLGALLVAAGLTLLGGCMVGPDYVRPTSLTAPAYKETEGWKMARPQDEVLRGPWWETYGDPQLNELEEQVNISNQNLAFSEAQFRQARALVLSAQAAFFPTVTIGVAAARKRESENVAHSSGASSPFSDYSLPLQVSWELDVWGRIRRALESNQANAQASAGDLEATRLSLQAELAQDYFLLRATDAQRELLDETVADYAKSLELTKNRYASGVASKSEVVLAVGQLESTKAQAIDLGVQRAQLEHAIAVLIGTPASAFSLPAAPLRAEPPAIPVGLPSELLERRPDIAAAERRVAAANAQIGVALAAYYPTVTLSASGGFESSDAAKWLVWPSRFWSIGPAISETVYDAGLRAAQTQQARAVYDATVAAYRESVLTGFQEVEDNLAALRILEEEARVQDGAVDAARESVVLGTNQYKGGTISYLDVVILQTALLNNQRTAVDVLGRRMSASVLLIKALGGGWDASTLPSTEELISDNEAHKSRGD